MSTRPSESAEITDDEAEQALLALAGKPPRMPWMSYIAAGYRVAAGMITTDAVGRARGRASARLIAAHRAEFERYWLDEQWKIVRGETK